VPSVAAQPVSLVVALVGGWIAADFVSGLVHWFADTWGSSSWPLVGNTLIRSFREHHVDALAITRHDFVETNGASCLVCLPVLVFATWLATTELNAATTFVVAGLVSFCFWILMTNQAHKWAHRGRTRGLVAWLQKARVLLRVEAHAVHHRAPFEHSYCITSGVMNPVLDRIGFFRRCEAVITWATGAEPREEDKRNLGLV